MLDITRGWLPFLAQDAPDTASPLETARAELRGTGVLADVDGAMPRDAYEIRGDRVTGGSVGVLYGAYALLMARTLGEPCPEGLRQPYFADRMLNCWDNMDGSIERGYAGPSLWFRDGRIDYEPRRLRRLARLLASVGLNVLCVNNVNVREPAQELIGAMLPDLARLAALFRGYGIRLMVSIDFSQPLRDGLPTADPLDGEVQRWWAHRADTVWAAIPDLAGFLVKADSEHRPGPFSYGRTHAEGANMLARAVAPHGGLLVWRAFVYNCMQDWRDHSVDRPCAAWDTYHPLDGRFDGNVLLQVKNGPYDFQVREPVSPLLLGMEKTRLALEFQLTQEYTGHQIDLYAMPPMWREVLAQAVPERLSAMAAVSNLGRSPFFTGHPFALVNLFGFGLLCWDPSLSPEEIIRRWCRLSYGQEGALAELLLESRRVYELYTSPLGLCWMVNPQGHYGPSPGGYEFSLWGTYHRADREAVGIDRTSAGTGYTLQYPEPLRSLYEHRETCPEELLLFFHRVGYRDRLRDGRTLIQRIYDDHFEGLARTEAMAETLRGLSLPEDDRAEALRRMELQLDNAREWCDVINTFFHRYSGVPDARGRKIWP